MSFADPHSCPSCGGAIAEGARCPHCRFLLNSPSARLLWQTLLTADEVLAEARRESLVDAGPLVPVGVSMPRPAPPVPAPADSSEPRRPPLSTGSVILGLGALFLIVAAIVFISVSWDVLGADGRTLVLLVVTGILAGIAVWSTRRRLRASAEAMWAVFFGFFSIDYFAARSYGLLGLDSLNGANAVLLFGVLVAVLGGLVALMSRRLLTLHVPSVLGGLAVWLASFALAGVIGGPFFWCALAGLALAGLATTVAWRFHLRLFMVIAGAAMTLLYLLAVGGAIAELAEHPHIGQLTAHGIPMAIMVVLTIGAGVAFERLRLPSAAFVTLGISALMFAPSIAASTPEGGYVAGAALAVVLTAGLIRGTSNWIRGARIGGAAIFVALTIASLGWLNSAIESISTAGSDPFSRGWSARLVNGADLPGPAWVAFIAFAAIATSSFAVVRWPEARPYAGPLRLLPLFVAGLGGGLGVVAAEPPAVLAAVGVLALGIGLLVSTWRSHPAWQGLALGFVVVPVVMALPSEAATLAIWIAVALALASVAFLTKIGWMRSASAFGAAGLAIGSVALVADLASLGVEGMRLVVLIASIAVLATASFPLRGFVARIEIELAGSIAMIVVLLSAVDEGQDAQALLWTVAGAALVLLGLFVTDRRWLRITGSGALGVAWVLRLLASDVGTIEAYTAPFALVLLAAGLWAMRGDVQIRTIIALTPGLSLALLPSIPQALAEPTGPRALLLGVAALIALAAGIGKKWQMPFAYGSAVLALLVVWNVGPAANGLPRWVLIATAGVILTGFGITWENRVRNARSVAQYVQSLR